MPGPFVLLGDEAIADRPVSHEITPTSLGFLSQPLRTRFLAYAPRYAFDPGAVVPIYAGAEVPLELEYVTVHDALTNARLKVLRVEPDIVTGLDACTNSGEGGCGYPQVFELDTVDLGIGLIYLNLVARNGRISQPLFILLRAPTGTAAARVALMHPDFTWQAYNKEGGASFYTPPNGLPRFTVSLRRPIDQRSVYDYHNARACAPVMRMLAESAAQTGAGVRHFSNHDLHDSAGFLDGVDVLVLCGHDEYWTREMRANVDAFSARGGRIACFSGNTNWWQTRLIGDTLYLSAEEVEPVDTPFAGTGYLFKDWVKNPIEPVIGLGYVPGGYAVRYYHTEQAAEERGITREDYEASRGIAVVEPQHPIFAGTGLGKGDIFGANSDVMHVEIDAAYLRGDGQLDRTRWKFTPRNLKVLGRALIFMASYPPLMLDPSGLFHVGCVIAEVPGNSKRGAALHFGSVGWYRALAAGDKQCWRIALNAIAYLLSDPRTLTSGVTGKGAGSSDVTPPPGAADINRRAFLALSGAALTAGAGISAVGSALSQPSAEKPSPADETLEMWAGLRSRALAGEAMALEELAARILNEESIGSETFVELLGMLEAAAASGSVSALIKLYMLSHEAFDGLNPSSAIKADLSEKLRGAGTDITLLMDAVSALSSGETAKFEVVRPELERHAPNSPEFRLLLAVAALAHIDPGMASDEISVYAGLLPQTPLGLAVDGQLLARAGRTSEARERFERSAAAGYSKSNLLLARLDAIAAKTVQECRSALDRLQAIGLSGSQEALLMAAEISVQKASILEELEPRRPLLQNLAEQGYGNASYVVGLMAAAGVGGPIDPQEAIRQMAAAAARRQPSAEFQMGVWAYAGFGVVKDRIAAASWFARAASDGDPRAMYNLALMHEAGDSIEENLAAAHALMEQAGAAGLPEAREWLRRN
jgi:TPR repeat protein